MNRYLLFAYAMYYPAGGMEDLVGKFKSLNEISTHLHSDAFYNQANGSYNSSLEDIYIQIVDTSTMEYVIATCRFLEILHGDVEIPNLQ